MLLSGFLMSGDWRWNAHDSPNSRKGTKSPPRSRELRGGFPLFLLVYWQLGNLNEAILVLQLNVPLFMRYSFVYQNVQSFTGSTLMLL